MREHSVDVLRLMEIPYVLSGAGGGHAVQTVLRGCHVTTFAVDAG